MGEQTPLTVLKGIGPALADKLDRLGLSSVQDLLFHLPMRYQDRTRVTPIGALRPGLDAVIEGTVLGAEVVMGRRRSLLCRIQDGSGTLSLRFYYFSAALKANLSLSSLDVARRIATFLLPDSDGRKLEAACTRFT